jgi:putative membrane protein
VTIAANLVVGLVIAIHLYIVVLEMALWTRPRGRAAFGTTPEYAESTKALAANQGLYNGFLAAGLIWALLADGSTAYQAKLFFLGCVLVAGLYGAATVSRRILFVQAVPAAIGLALVLIAG